MTTMAWLLLALSAMADVVPIPPSPQGFIWPVHGWVASTTKYWGGRSHSGSCDLSAPYGSPVVAARGGRVAGILVNSKYGGNGMKIDHGGGWLTLYSHFLEPPALKVGDRIETGRYLGRVGRTGNAAHPHLHFQINGPGGRVAIPGIDYGAWVRQGGAIPGDYPGLPSSGQVPPSAASVSIDPDDELAGDPPEESAEEAAGPPSADSASPALASKGADSSPEASAKGEGSPSGPSALPEPDCEVNVDYLGEPLVWSPADDGAPGFRVRIAGGLLEARVAPAPGAPAAATLAAGTLAEVLDSDRGWLRVRLADGSEGWIPWSGTLPETSGLFCVRVERDNLDVRSGPQGDAASAGRLRRGRILPVFEERAGFFKILFRQGEPTCRFRWIEAAAVKRTEGFPTTIRTHGVKVHAEPRPDAPEIGALKFFDRINALEVRDGWYRIRVGDREGWVGGWFTQGPH